MLNEILQIISMVLCFVGLLQVLVGPKKNKEPVRFYIAFFSILFFYSIFILLGLTLEAQEGAVVHEALRFSNFFEFLSAYSLTYLVISRLAYRADPSKKSREYKILSAILKSVFVTQTALLVLSFFTGFCYYIDSANIYRRSAGFPLLFVTWGIQFLIGLYILARHGNSFSRLGQIATWIFGSSILAAFLLQVFITGIYFVSFSTSVSALMLYIIFVTESTELYYQKERENDKLKVDIMLSQIQPHFLYNSLTVIKHFCRRDPELAEKAVVDFSTYLRGNMDSLSVDVPIMFETELKHTNAYLSLEKLRFEDNLQIKYDIECIDFSLPPLTLQPIVENAVRHGVRETDDGKGTVTIATRELDDRYEITVSDDGNGFDPQQYPETDKPHIGIENVRYRLKNMCGGTLTFDSAIGKGTVAAISVPKGE